MKQSNVMTGICGTCVLVAGAILWLGCDEKKQPPKQPTPPAPDVTPKAGGGAVGGVTGGGGGGGSANTTTAPSTTQTPDPKAAAGPAVAPLPPSKEAEQSRQAEELITKARQAITDN